MRYATVQIPDRNDQIETDKVIYNAFHRQLLSKRFDHGIFYGIEHIGSHQIHTLTRVRLYDSNRARVTADTNKPTEIGISVEGQTMDEIIATTPSLLN